MSCDYTLWQTSLHPLPGFPLKWWPHAAGDLALPIVHPSPWASASPRLADLGHSCCRCSSQLLWVHYRLVLMLLLLDLQRKQKVLGPTGIWVWCHWGKGHARTPPYSAYASAWTPACAEPGCGAASAEANKCFFVDTWSAGLTGLIDYVILVVRGRVVMQQTLHFITYPFLTSKGAEVTGDGCFWTICITMRFHLKQKHHQLGFKSIQIRISTTQLWLFNCGQQ